MKNYRTINANHQLWLVKPNKVNSGNCNEKVKRIISNKKIFVSIIAIFWINFAFGTGQVPDYLILNKDTIAIFSNPLEQYFDKIGKRKLIDFNGGCGSTACWRGYKAIWQIRNDSLFLNRVTACHKDCGNSKDANLKAMFGSTMPFADWVTGDLIAPRGKRLRYIHMGYASIFEKEQIFKIKNGKVKKIKIKINKKEACQIYKENQSKEMTKLALDTIFHTIKTGLDWKELDKSDYICDDEYFLTFNKRGRIKKVKFVSVGEEKLEEWWYNITEWKCRRKIKKALKSLNLNYLNPNVEAIIRIEIFYKDEKNGLELWKPFWLEKWERKNKK